MDYIRDGWIVVIILVSFALGLIIGLAVMSSWTASDCNNFGKTTFGTTVYECSQGKNSKIEETSHE